MDGNNPLESASAPISPRAISRILHFATSYQVSQALYVAARLGIADLLKNGPLTVGEMAIATKVQENALYRLLRALASIGVFHEIEPDRFALTPEARALQRRPDSLRDVVLWTANPFHYRAYAHLQDCVGTGQPQYFQSGDPPIFERLKRDPEMSDAFHGSLTTMTALAIPAILAKYDFAGIQTVVDVAGGHGYLLTAILEQYPEAKGVLCELPYVTEGASERVRSLGLQTRCRVVPNDFFASIPSGGDLYIFKNVVHDWPDDRSLLILRNCHKAINESHNPRAKLLLVEMVVSTANRFDAAKWMDIEMLALTGGRERDENEYRTLLGDAGFRVTRVLATDALLSIIEAAPQA